MQLITEIIRQSDCHQKSIVFLKEVTKIFTQFGNAMSGLLWYQLFVQKEYSEYLVYSFLLTTLIFSIAYSQFSPDKIKQEGQKK